MCHAPSFLQVEPYVNGRSSLGRIDRRCALLKMAIKEADVLVEKSDSERLETCQYIGKGHKKHSKKAKKSTDEETAVQQHTVKPAHQISVEKLADLVKPTDILKLCNPHAVGSLEKLLADSSFNLKEFVQTHFTVDGSGVVRQATSPRGVTATRNGRRKKKGTLEMNVEPSNRSSAGKPGRKPGQQKSQKGTVQNSIHPPSATQTVVVCKQIPPTDYFGSSGTAWGCSGTENMVCNSPVRKVHDSNPANSSSTARTIVPVNQPPQGDQGVLDSIASAEAQALKELEDIEGMLSTFGEDTTNMVPGKARERTEELKHGIDSEWVESVLGDINQIEGELILTQCKRHK